MTRRRKIFAVVSALVLFLLLFLFHFKQLDNYKCVSCHSWRSVFQWRLGMWPCVSVPLSPEWERIHESHLLRELLPKGHQHQWKFAGESPYLYFGLVWGGCILGDGRHMNEFCQWYESDPEFRKLVGDKVEKGELSKETIEQIAALPSLYGTDGEGDAVVPELVTLARELIHEATRGRLPQGWYDKRR